MPRIKHMLSIKQFCQVVGISQSTYYAKKLTGETPAEIHIGDRRLIHPSTAEAWLRAREKSPSPAQAAAA